ncbi:hypothetical protein ACFL0Q_08695 [Thermodesulfobacteriota bacterium]
MLFGLQGQVWDLRKFFLGPIFLFLPSHGRHALPYMVVLSTENHKMERAIFGKGEIETCHHSGRLHLFARLIVAGTFRLPQFEDFLTGGCVWVPLRLSEKSILSLFACFIFFS